MNEKRAERLGRVMRRLYKIQTDPISDHQKAIDKSLKEMEIIYKKETHDYDLLLDILGPDARAMRRSKVMTINLGNAIKRLRTAETWEDVESAADMLYLAYKRRLKDE